MPISGKGDYPFNSAWAMRRKGSINILRKQSRSPINIYDMWIDWFFGVAEGITYFGILKRWTGSIWIKEPLKTYLAGSFQSKPLKRWDGGEWKLVDTTGI